MAKSKMRCLKRLNIWRRDGETETRGADDIHCLEIWTSDNTFSYFSIAINEDGSLQVRVNSLDEVISMEYVLIGGVNDRPEDARLLGRLLKNLPCKVNLIPFNRIPQSDFQPPTSEAVAAFLQEIRQSRILTTLRSSRGSTISAACGQLAGHPAQRAA